MFPPAKRGILWEKPRSLIKACSVKTQSFLQEFSGVFSSRVPLENRPGKQDFRGRIVNFYPLPSAGLTGRGGGFNGFSTAGRAGQNPVGVPIHTRRLINRRRQKVAA
jgi:hypothetical protein